MDHGLRTTAAAVMELSGVVLNALLFLFALWACLRLAGASSGYLANAGGMPPLSIDGMMALATGEGFHLRLFWWMAAWTAMVFAVGFGLLAVAGGRWVWIRAKAALES